ncbi:OmpL47-type beta-barrel domain-containing protein [Planococcus shixiaomingii]|uniref:OmpL47-type beta-barrel domain-containing protein n=1 Tax=Planococcus shixiaomingii TaxID=3058393 RepID=UPI002615FF7F|nr:hypothetical protein [Planococcus sp. N022]WKA53933.1 hypothetical protein QWY21_14855 [Planococcus sp. N022]
MLKKNGQISLLLSVLLVLQLILSTTAAVAAELENPLNLRLTVNSGNNITLRWDAISSAEKYNVYRINDDERTLMSSTTNTAFSMANMPQNTYTYEVASFNAATGESDFSRVIYTLVHPEMAAPANLSLSVRNGNDLLLKWAEVEFAISYNIYQIKDGIKTLVFNTTSLSKSFGNMPAGDYEYEVTSVSTRFGESKTASSAKTELVHPKMESPSEVSISIKNGNDLQLRWIEAAYATSYNIYQVKNGVKELKATVEGVSRTFSNMPEGDYEYEVTSVSTRFGESKIPTSTKIILKHPEMAAPQNLSQLIRNGNDLVLRWAETEFATSYNIYQVKNGVKELKTTVEGVSRTFTNMPEGNYQYEINSVSTRFGESKSAASIATTLIHPEMKAPLNLNLSIRNGNDVFLKWDEVEFATSYNIYQIVEGKKKFVLNTTGLTRNFADMPAGDYVYEVSSVSSRFGESKTTSKVQTTLVHPVMAAPEDLKLTVVNGNNLSLKWTETQFATGYNIYRIKDGIKKLAATTTSASRTFTNMPEDWYEYEVTAISSRFGESAPSKVEYTLGFPKVQSPELKIVPFDTQTAKLNWTEITGASVYNVFEVINGEYILLGSTDKRTFNVEKITDGKHEYVVTVTHSRFGDSGYSNLVGLEVQSDKTAPTTSASASDVWQKQDVSFELTAEDDKSGVASTFYSLNGIDFKEGTSVTVNKTQKVSFYSVDKAGNVEEVKTAQVNIDKIAPETNSNANNNWYQEYTVKFTAEDAQSGVDKTFYSENGSAFIEGESVVVNKEGINTVSFYSTDIAGNVEEAKTAEVKIDQTAPETASNADAEWHQEFAVDLTATDDKAGVETTFYSLNGATFKEGTNFTISEEGINTISFYSVDKAGNSEEAKTAEVKIDQSAPETAVNTDEEWHKEFNVKLTATDDKSEVANTFYSLNGSEFAEGTSFTVDKEGINKIEFYSVNIAGGVEEVKTAEVKIDRTAPETEATQSADWQLEAVVELSATDEKSGVDKTFYSVNGSDFTEGTSVAVTKAGVNNVAFYSVDKVGNKEEMKTIEVNIDVTAPETASNAAEQWFQEFAVELTATDDQSGVAQTFYSVNGSEFVEGTNFTVTEEGINTISFYSVDKAGNKEEVKTAEVKIDRSAPVTNSNADNVWHQEFAVELTAEDDKSRVANTFYSINGSDFTEGTSFTVETEGINEISFYSVDKAGNKEEVKTAEVKIDFTSPETLSNITDNWLKEDFAVELTAKDGLSGVAATYYALVDAEFAEGTSFLVSEEGVNDVQFYSTDIAGNKEQANTAQVKIDKTAPTVSWALNREYALGTKLPLSYSAADAVSGIASEKLTVNGKEVENGETISFDQPGEYKIQVTVTDNAGWTTMLEKTIAVYIPVNTIKINPGVIKGNSGVFNVQVSLPKGFSTKDFVLETAAINGVSAISGKNGFDKQAENGHFRFEREDFIWYDGEQSLEFRGMVDDYLVIGQATVETKGSNKK